jgi:glycosyltransferase involved in cell wall biosynthesis
MVREPVHYVLVEEGFSRRNVTGAKPAKPESWITILHKQAFFKQSNQILEENKDAVHVFLSFWGDKRLFRVLLRALWRRHSVAVIFEPYATVPYGYWKDEKLMGSHLKVFGRHIAYRMLWSLLRLAARGKLPCVLAVSPLAEEQLRRVGFQQEVIFPFGYFIERIECGKPDKEHEQPLRVLFSGSLIMRKGLDIALAAVREVNTNEVRVQFDIYGPGDIDRFLSSNSPGIRYMGTYSQPQAQSIMSGYDLLLVPSHHEGWGLVVNEALMQGVPVLASDRVGAGCLLVNSGAGRIFRSGDIVQLSVLLTDLSADQVKLREMAAACEHVGERITPLMGADYLMKVFDYYFNQRGAPSEAMWLI